jgi:hypothetical protein
MFYFTQQCALQLLSYVIMETASRPSGSATASMIVQTIVTKITVMVSANCAYGGK